MQIYLGLQRCQARMEFQILPPKLESSSPPRQTDTRTHQLHLEFRDGLIKFLLCVLHCVDTED